MRKIRIGLVPERRWLADQKTRKGIFQPSYAIDNKNHVLDYTKKELRGREYGVHRP